jgi:3-methyladenine DNA glycosylase AlkC
MKEKFSLKDVLYNSEKVSKIATEIKTVYPDFEQEAFENDVLTLFPDLELKERMYHIRDILGKYLPQEYREATNILLQALPEALDNTKSDDDFGDFIYAPYGEFVALHGCCAKHVDFSLQALREISKRFSVEFAIRDFLNIFPTETLAMLEACSLSDNYHERRLASEGLRPKLPWAKKLTIHYSEPLTHLENLFDDNTRYVTRSVANHLNDIAKMDAPLVINTLKRWKTSGKHNAKEMDYIINHALRILVKQGNEDALALLGYGHKPDIKMSDFVLQNKEVSVGEALLFDFKLEAKEDTKLMIDYIIHFRTKAGTLSPKVYKLKKVSLKKGESLTLQKKHPFKANMTTRTLYEGEHKIELQIIGMIYANEIFTLKEQ